MNLGGGIGLFQMNLVPSEGVAGDTIGLHFIFSEDRKNKIDYLKIEGKEAAFENEYVQNSYNVHGDQSVEYKLWNRIRGLY